MPVGHPAEIDEIFDAISYSKGASVIRMLHDYIGDEVSSNTNFVLSYSALQRMLGCKMQHVSSCLDAKKAF